MKFSPVAGVKLCPICKDDGTGEKEKCVSCEQCGAELKFEPGASQLKCPYCAHETKIKFAELGLWSAHRENDFHTAVSKMLKAHDPDMVEIHTVKCGTCAAESTLDAHVDADECPYCGASLHRRSQATRKVLKPQALLPFKIQREEALEKFQEWIESLGFAPKDLQNFARVDDRLRGVYMPYWTYDADTVTFYNGTRGELSGGDDKQAASLREVCGCVKHSFDDLLVLGSDSLPRRLVEKLEPWDLKGLMPCQEEFLSGFRAENYSVDLANGFQMARKMMDPEIDRDIRRDIGGDTQKISDKEIRYARITYKHILLPVWVSAFRYRNKVFRFLVNARTGEVQGERPHSIGKYVLATVIGIALLVAVLVLILKK